MQVLYGHETKHCICPLKLVHIFGVLPLFVLEIVAVSVNVNVNIRFI